MSYFAYSEFFGNILKGKKDKVLIMADESATNGVVFHDAEIGANDDSKVESKTSALSQKLVALEKENRELVRENEVVKEIEEKLKKTIEKLENEKDELRKKVEKPGLENRALGSLAARASELEGELVWLQHNLINATYDLAETNYEVSQLKTVLEGSKTREEEKRSKLETVEGEKNMLITKLTNLESTENDLRSEVEAKQKEFRAVLRKCAILFNVDKRRKELRKLLDEEEKVKKELEEKLEKERVIRLK
ncbi:PREDICTED: peroxisomal and mitochondrial division factor 2-like isoform X1 [Ipomoea nil]|uniref:peroxisomal and mitochondrial division factor 2-like isoform X1 n=2 Tax=Ipomoea nil TaxID=35883 RepID=UPI000900C73B|nr:PREDICTED: peroxisomal and mitochondrial division factor 2-like isoform X1 [Ipomoea nil]